MATNASDPVYPFTKVASQDYYGLTKREYIATAIAAGLAQKYGFTDQEGTIGSKSVELTDALIAALNAV